MNKSLSAIRQDGLTHCTYVTWHIDLSPLRNELQHGLVSEHVHPTAMLIENVLQADVAVVAGHQSQSWCQRHRARQMNGQVALPALLALLQHSV